MFDKWMNDQSIPGVTLKDSDRIGPVQNWVKPPNLTKPVAQCPANSPGLSIMVTHLGSPSPILCPLAFRFLSYPIKRCQPSQLSPWKSDCKVKANLLDQLIHASGIMEPIA